MPPMPDGLRVALHAGTLACASNFAEYCVPNPDWRPGFYYFLCSIDRGFVVGSNGKIARTSNRGELWEIQNNFDFSERVDLEAVIAYSKLRHVEAVTSEIAWTVGDGGIILSTTDGGHMWRVQDSGTVKDLYKSHFESNTTGWVVGSRGLLLKTTNAGATWVLQISPSLSRQQNFYEIKMYQDLEHSEPVAFIGSDDGLILYTVNRSVGVGENATWERTWANATCGSAAIYGIAFHQEAEALHPHRPLLGRGYAIGPGGSICETDDKGQSWEHQELTSLTDLFAIDIYDDGPFNPIMAVRAGRNSAIGQNLEHMYVNGIQLGVKWTEVPSDSWAHLHFEMKVPVTDNVNYMSRVSDGDEEGSKFCLKGKLAEVYMWTRQLDAYEVRRIGTTGFTIAAPDEILLAYYPLEEGEGILLYDFFQKHEEMDVVNEPSWLSEDLWFVLVLMLVGFLFIGSAGAYMYRMSTIDDLADSVQSSTELNKPKRGARESMQPGQQEYTTLGAERDLSAPEEDPSGVDNIRPLKVQSSAHKYIRPETPPAFDSAKVHPVDYKE
eukprot:gene779-1251_t